jgi:molybdate transport system substrate-binding protein
MPVRGRRAGPSLARRLLVLLLTAFVVAACTADDDELTVFAAASLRTLVDELEVAWSAEHPDVPLTVSTEASNVLAAQIAEGAPADVFISADRQRPRQLAEAGLTFAQPVPFAFNSLTLVVPAGSVRLVTPLDVARPGIRLVGVNEGAPIARYAEEAIAALAATSSQPGAFLAGVEANLASREDNVAAALAKVALGEGDAAFVYRTDALASEAVEELPLPADAAVRAAYDAVQVSGSARAAEFVRWLTGPETRAIIAAAGFETVAP